MLYFNDPVRTGLIIYQLIAPSIRSAGKVMYATFVLPHTPQISRNIMHTVVFD